MRLHSLWERLVFGADVTKAEDADRSEARARHREACEKVHTANERTQEVTSDILEKVREQIDRQ